MSRSRLIAPACVLALLSFACGGEPQLPPEPVDAGGEEPAPGDEERPPARTSWLAGEAFLHDFGTVYPQSLHHVVFRLAAAGTEPLVMRELKHSCGCTAGELYALVDGVREPVEPGRAYPVGTPFELAATLNTKGRTGVQEQKIKIVHESGHLDTFVMAADIKPFLVAEPDALTLQDVDPFEGAEATFRLTARNGEAFTPKLWRKILGESVELELIPEGLDDDGRSDLWTGRVRVLPGRAGETVRSKLILTADVPNLEAAPNDDGTPALQRLELVVAASVEPVVRAWPERYQLGRLAPGDELVKKITLRSVDRDHDLRQAEVRLLDARGETAFPHPEACEVRVVPGTSTAELELNLVIRPLPRTGTFAGRVDVRLGHPLQAGLSIPFQGTTVE